MARLLLIMLGGMVVSSVATAQSGHRVLYLYGYIDAQGQRPGEPNYRGTPFHPMRLDNVDDDAKRGMSQFKQAIEEAATPAQPPQNVR